MYLLTCSHCQCSIPITPAQAGDETTCSSCGQLVQVPKLGELRQLPLAEKTAPPPDDTANTQSVGLNTAFVILSSIATVSLLAAAFCGIRWSLIEVTNNTTQHVGELRQAYLDAKPAELIREWEAMEKSGTDIVFPYTYQKMADEKRRWGNNAAIAGTIGGLSVLAAWGVGLAGSRSRSKYVA